MKGNEREKKEGDQAPEVIEVEVERLPLDGPGAAPPPPKPGATARRVTGVMGPILAGILVDALDAATVTPILGACLGLPLGYYIAHQVGFRGGAALRLALAIGIYCVIPGTPRIPLGTLIGAYARLRQALAAGRQ